MRDKKAFIFYFLMSIIFLDFGNQLKILSSNPYFAHHGNFLFSITRVNNSGGAFGLFRDNPKILAFLGIFVIAYLTFYVIKYVSFKDKFTLLSSVLFCAGTLGNVIERLKYNHVVDYIKLSFIDFPVFNAFDIMICTGIALYILFVLFQKEESNDKDKDNKPG